MTLYTYMPGKAELLDLMLDTAYGWMSLTDTTGRPWRERLVAVAEENRALYEAHPWVASVSTVRPPLGPGLMAKYEHELRALEGMGLSDVQMDASLTFLLSFVQTCALGSSNTRAAGQGSAMDDVQWWAANAPLLSRIFDAEQISDGFARRGRSRRCIRQRVQPTTRLRVRSGACARRPRRAR